MHTSEMDTSQFMLTLVHNTQLNRKKAVKDKTNLHTKSQLVPADLSPDLAAPLTSATPTLPFICPARRPALMSAHSQDVAQNRPKGSFWCKQTTLGGAEGSMGIWNGTESQNVSLENALPTSMSSWRLRNLTWWKNLRASTKSSKPTLPCKNNHKERLHILYSAHL